MSWTSIMRFSKKAIQKKINWYEKNKNQRELDDFEKKEENANNK